MQYLCCVLVVHLGLAMYSIIPGLNLVGSQNLGSIILYVTITTIANIMSHSFHFHFNYFACEIMNISTLVLPFLLTAPQIVLCWLIGMIFCLMYHFYYKVSSCTVFLTWYNFINGLILYFSSFKLVRVQLSTFLR